MGGALRLWSKTSYGATLATATRCTFKQNEQTSTTVVDDNGGGALYADNLATFIIRDSTFIENKAANSQGHHLMTDKDSSMGTPSISLINTRMTHCDTCSANNFWNYIVGAHRQNRTIWANTPTKNCSTALSQCEDNGYPNAICTTRQNPDEGRDMRSKLYTGFLQDRNIQPHL